jgi:hypothetical protein
LIGPLKGMVFACVAGLVDVWYRDPVAWGTVTKETPLEPRKSDSLIFWKTAFSFIENMGFFEGGPSEWLPRSIGD